ncbi:MAG: cytochrome c oxidase subunit II [Solirubrobacterales bacterium]
MKASHRIAAVVAIIGSSAALIAFTFLYDWFPPLMASEDGKIDTLYKWLVAASIPFFVIIVAFAAFCVIEFRAKPGDPDDKDGEPLHGSTRIEIVWTVIPTIIVLALGVYAWIVLDDVEAKKKNELKINVVGQQFIFNYEYPVEKVKTSGELVVPVGRPLYFEMTSKDVIHSFFVPAARLKRDVADGYTTILRFTPDKLGTYPIVCAELCGIGHATMRSQIRVVSEEDFKAWVAKQTGSSAAGSASKGENTPSATIDGKSVFTAAGCGGCHTLASAGGAGTTGPALDDIGSKGPESVRESIVDPDKTVADGFSKGIMPATYGKDLSKEEIDALVEFIAGSAS